ncbi:MAG: FAD-dependent oxidoreductase [Rhodocyclaceae bacterium]|nr:FAD-dependent oxidoreductase [Rhodocyclaceae bacterium]
MAEMKTAAYICSGCGIGERVSTTQMAKIAQKEGKMALVREHACLCDESGVQTIKDDIEKEAVTHIVLAACSRRVKTEAFNFPTVAMARANIREGVIWSQPEDPEHAETTQEMADDYVRMGCAEVKKMKVPEGNPNRASNKRILVVGGGVSGMTSALEMAEAGYDTVLVEKSGALGGWAAELVKRVPSQQPYADPADTGVAELAAKVAAHPRIALHLNSTIAQTDGAPGRFSVSIAQESGATVTEEVGALIQATGFTPYDMMKLPELGAGKSPNVVDQLGLEKLVKAANGGAVKRPSDGGEVKRVVFIQCAGQRDESQETEGRHLPYCSGHAAPPASSRPCTSRTPIPTSTRW